MPPQAVELQLTVRRIQGSLGFGVDKNNLVVALKPDGAATRDGLLQKNDQVVAVDGRLLGGRKMSQEINPDENVYMLTVVRHDASLRESVDRLPPAHPAAAAGSLLHLARAIVNRDGKEPLGLEMTSSNVVKRLLDGGAAMRGGVQLADVAVAVNGIWLGERRVVDVLAKAVASPIVFTLLRVEERDDGDSDTAAVQHQHTRPTQPPTLVSTRPRLYLSISRSSYVSRSRSRSIYSDSEADVVERQHLLPMQPPALISTRLGLSIYLSIRLSICLSIYLSIYLSIDRSIDSSMQIFTATGHQDPRAKP